MTDGRHHNPRSDRQAKDVRATNVKATALLHNASKSWPPFALKATDPADDSRCGALAQKYVGNLSSQLARGGLRSEPILTMSV